MEDRMVRKKDKTQGRWEENWAQPVSSKGKLIQSKQTEMEPSCPAWCFNKNLGAFASVVYSLWRIPCFSSWVQVPQHTRAAPPSNWEKMDGPVPFSMISLPIYKGSKTPRITSGKLKRGRKEMKPQRRAEATLHPWKTEKKREYKVPGCDQALLNKYQHKIGEKLSSENTTLIHQNDVSHNRNMIRLGQSILNSVRGGGASLGGYVHPKLSGPHISLQQALDHEHALPLYQFI